MYFSQFEYAPIPEGVGEAVLIVRAQAGDEEAMTTLIRAYLPGLGAQIKRFENVYDDSAEAEQEVLSVFLAHVHGIDVTEYPSCRGFGHKLGRRYQALLAQRNGFGVPARVMPWYVRTRNRALEELGADADDNDILNHAKEQIDHMNAAFPNGSHISYAMFGDIFRAADTVEALPSDFDCAEAERNVIEEEWETIRECVDRLPSDLRAIVRYAYGFETPRPLSDGEVVEEWSRATLPPEKFEAGSRMTSRRTVARKRAEALDLLREDYLRSFNGLEQA